MAFPDTRATLVQRIVSTGDEGDWRQFLDDYWGPVCRFAARRANLGAADAEDIAAQTFEALLANRLLARWVLNRSAKLRTLLCTVTRNVMSNRARVEQGRARLMREHLEQGGELIGLDAPVEQIDAFYASWVEDLVEQAVERLLDEYHRQGKGDYFRVLYGRLCDEMPMAEVAALLDLKVTSAENYFKAARKRLGAILQEQVEQHVARYAAADPGQQGPSQPKPGQQEFDSEWRELGEYLAAHGGLEDAVRRAYALADPALRRQRKTEQITLMLARVRGTAGGSAG